MKKILCLTKANDEGFELQSPLIASISMHVFVGDTIGKNQVIGVADRNGEKFALLNADECGVIKSVKSNKKSFDVHFREPFMWANNQELGKKIAHQQADSVMLTKGEFIVAPMDGLIYLRPNPQSDAFVNVGDRIKPGTTLGLIEVMKNFYPLKYELTKPALVSKILVNDMSCVANAQPIFCIEFE